MHTFAAASDAFLPHTASRCPLQSTYARNSDSTQSATQIREGHSAHFATRSPSGQIFSPKAFSRKKKISTCSYGTRSQQFSSSPHRASYPHQKRKEKNAFLKRRNLLLAHRNGCGMSAGRQPKPEAIVGQRCGFCQEMHPDRLRALGGERVTVR